MHQRMQDLLLHTLVRSHERAEWNLQCRRLHTMATFVNDSESSYFQQKIKELIATAHAMQRAQDCGLLIHTDNATIFRETPRLAAKQFGRVSKLLVDIRKQRRHFAFRGRIGARPRRRRRRDPDEHVRHDLRHHLNDVPQLVMVLLVLDAPLQLLLPGRLIEPALQKRHTPT